MEVVSKILPADKNAIINDLKEKGYYQDLELIHTAGSGNATFKHKKSEMIFTIRAYNQTPYDRENRFYVSYDTYPHRKSFYDTNLKTIDVVCGLISGWIVSHVQAVLKMESMPDPWLDWNGEKSTEKEATDTIVPESFTPEQLAFMDKLLDDYLLKMQSVPVDEQILEEIRDVKKSLKERSARQFWRELIGALKIVWFLSANETTRSLIEGLWIEIRDYFVNFKGFLD